MDADGFPVIDGERVLAKTVMQLILHIGMAKTGTTSIQRTFFKLKHDGVTYLPWPAVNHVAWFYQQFEDEDRLEQVQHFRAGLSRDVIMARRREQFDALEAFLAERKPPRLVVSAERLSVLEHDAPVERMRDYFAALGATARVVAYIRPPAGFLQSGYQQMLKGRVLDELRLENALPFYRKGLERYDRIFGPDRVTLRLFDRRRLHNGDVVLDFAREIGIDLEPEDVIHDNESLSLDAAALLYVHRHFGQACNVDPRLAPQQTNAFVDILRQIGTTRFAIGRDCLAPYLDMAKDDIAWMEARLGQSLHEDRPAEGPQIASLDELPAIAEAARGQLLRTVAARLDATIDTPQRTYLEQAEALLRTGAGVENLARALDALRLSVG